MRWALAAVLLVVGAGPSAAQDRRELLSWQFGDALEVRAPISLQVDWLTSPGMPSDVRLRRLRIATKGTVLRRIDFQVERALREGTAPWRDVFVDVEMWRPLKVRAGRFKVPVSLDYQTSGMRGILAERSRVVREFAPGRDAGVMAHGTPVRGVKYYAAAFRAHADRGATAAGRMTIAIRPVALGVSFASTRVETGTRIGELFVRGRRRHAGGDVEWSAGPVTARAEVLRVTHQRQRQGLDDQDLPPLSSVGWYVTGAWRAVPALELATRIERVRTRGGSGTQAAFTPRAPVVSGEGTHAWTIGGTWFVTRLMAVQVNTTRLRDERGGVLTGAAQWQSVMRVQLEV
jgi:phosphate-selective porin